MPLDRSRQRLLRLTAGFLLIGAAVYVLNALTCLYADDFSYTYTFAVTEGKYRISNLYELFLSQRNHYRVMNGRTVVHTLAQLFLMWGKPVFNFLNTLAFLGFGGLIYYHGSGSGAPLRPGLLFGGFALLWALTPAFGQSYLWLVGSCNYLFGILIILLVLIPVTRLPDGSGVPKKWWQTLLYCGACFCAGMTNENNMVALVCVFVCSILCLLIEKKRPPLWLFLGLVGGVAGGLALLLSPGQATRLQNAGGFGSLLDWYYRFVHTTKLLLIDLWPLLLMTAVGLAAGFLRRRPYRALLRMGVMLIAALASAYSMIAAPEFPLRVWSGPIAFFLILAVSAWRWGFPEKCPLGRRAGAAAAVLVLLACAVSYTGAAKDLLRTKRDFDAREAYIFSEKAAGRTDLALSPVRGQSKYNCYPPEGDLSSDSSVWPNTAYAMYYELDSVSKAGE